ncbi:hypothetical protein L7F22_028777 [Adiantum nelumboides]|nr:hypothetical protein [Adiantum nelumboides]
MEPLEAVMVSILTVILLFIVMSPGRWSSAAKAAASDGELSYEHPSYCISTRLDLVFSPSPPYTPFSLFEDEPFSPHHNDSSSTIAPPIESAVPSSAAPEPAPSSSAPLALAL